MELTPEFWKDYINKRKAEFSTNRVAIKDVWNEMAHYYKDFQKENGNGVIKKVPIQFLENRGIFSKNLTVADLCCGPGTHTIEFAKKCKSVFALDISDKMINMLKKKIKKENIKNVEIKCNDFFKEKFNKKFDLVFVSMSPVLNEIKTIDKLLNLSNRYIFLIFWANKRENEVFNKAYEAIFNKKFKWDILDITIIFNYLYSLGYYPEIFYKTTVWENKFPKEKIYEHILWHLKFYKDYFSEDEKNIVKDIVYNAKKVETKIKIGFLFLDKLDVL